MNDPQTGEKLQPVRMFPFTLELTEPEGEAIQAFRVWERAQDDMALRARLYAWTDITEAVGRFEQGDVSRASCVEDFELTPEEAAAVSGIVKMSARLAAVYLEGLTRGADGAESEAR